MKLGLIGYGAWGIHHARAIAQLPGLELVAIACRNAATAQCARRDYPDAFVTTDYAVLIARPDIDTVDVVAPNYLHAEIGCAALGAGKHVLLEKPMATSAADCDRLIQAARANGRVLSIGHEFRQSTQWGRIKTLIDAGTLGRTRFVNINLFRNQYRSGSEGWRYDRQRVGSWILEEAVHFFDFALWYMQDQGDPVAVSAHGTLWRDTPGMYDNFSARIRYASGAYATITQCLGGFEHHLTIEVVGEKGAVRANWAGAMDRDHAPRYDLAVRHAGVVFERGVHEAERIALEPSGEVFELVQQLALATNAMRAGRALVSGEEARKRVILCLEAERSAREGRELVLDLATR